MIKPDSSTHFRIYDNKDKKFLHRGSFGTFSTEFTGYGFITCETYGEIKTAMEYYNITNNEQYDIVEVECTLEFEVVDRD